MFPLKNYSSSSLENKLETAADEETIDILNELAVRSLTIFNDEKALETALKAEQLAIKIADDVRRADSLINIGRSHLYGQRYYLVAQFFEQALGIYQICENKTGIARSFYRIGDYYWVLRKNVDAQTYFTKALEIYVELSDAKETLNTQISLARVYLANHDYPIALKLFMSVLGEIGYDPNNYNSLLVADRIAEIYSLQKQYEAAIFYWEKAIELMNPTRDRAWIKEVHKSIGVAYLYIKNKPKAREFLLRSLELSIDEFDKANIHQIRGYLSYLDWQEEQQVDRRIEKPAISIVEKAFNPTLKPLLLSI